MTIGRMLPGLIALALAGAQAAADKIELLSAARVDGSGAITLRDVARLHGPRAERVGGIVLVEPGASASAPRSIEVGQLREALDEAGVNWAFISLRGGRCDLLPAAPAPVARTPEVEQAAAAVPGAPSVRTVVEHRLREIFGVADESKIRIRFEERDGALLAMPLVGEGGAARLVEAHTTGSSSRVPVSVSVYEGDSLIESRSIRVGVEIEREVCVVRAPIERRSAIEAESLVVESRWLTPDVSPATLGESVGAEARSRLEPGQVLTASDVTPPIVVRRGEQVMVHYLSGPVILKTKARALEDGRVGDRIRLEVLGSKRRLEARVDAPGRAVVRGEASEPGVLEEGAAAAGSPGGVDEAAGAGGVRVTRAR